MQLSMYEIQYRILKVEQSENYLRFLSIRIQEMIEL